MNANQFKELLLCLPDGSRACEDARKWAEGKDFETVWETCERGDWMLWLAKKMQDQQGWCDLRNLTLAKARCAKLVIHLMKDERSKKAVEVAEQFGLGNATHEELDAAANAAANVAYAAAYVAYAAANAAYAAANVASAANAAAYVANAANAAANARINTLKKCADICRETLTVPIK